MEVIMNIRKFYPMGLALASHNGHCSIEQYPQPVTHESFIPFLANLSEINEKISTLFATKKDIYETAMHIKNLIECAPDMSSENHDELLSMAYIELENQFPGQEEELKVVKYNIFKLKA